MSQLTIVTLNYNIINPTLGNLCHSPNEQTMQFSCKNDNVCMHCSNAPWKNMKAPWQCMNAAILLEQKKARNRQTPRSVLLWELGPGRPSAGGPRMDCRAVTSSGVVKISRLTSRLRRSARRLLTPCQDSVIKNRYWHLARTVWLKTVTDTLPGQCD